MTTNYAYTNADVDRLATRYVIALAKAQDAPAGIDRDTITEPPRQALLAALGEDTP